MATLREIVRKALTLDFLFFFKLMDTWVATSRLVFLAHYFQALDLRIEFYYFFLFSLDITSNQLYIYPEIQKTLYSKNFINKKINFKIYTFFFHSFNNFFVDIYWISDKTLILNLKNNLMYVLVHSTTAMQFRSWCECRCHNEIKVTLVRNTISMLPFRHPPASSQSILNWRKEGKKKKQNKV